MLTRELRSHVNANLGRTDVPLRVCRFWGIEDDQLTWEAENDGADLLVSAPVRAVTRPRLRRSAARIFPSPVSRTRDLIRRRDALGRCEPCSSRPIFRRLPTLPSRKRTGCSCGAAVTWCCSTSPSRVRSGSTQRAAGRSKPGCWRSFPRRGRLRHPYADGGGSGSVGRRGDHQGRPAHRARFGCDVVARAQRPRPRRAGVGCRTRDAGGAETGVDRAGLRRRPHRIPRGPGVTPGRGTSP